MLHNQLTQREHGAENMTTLIDTMPKTEMFPATGEIVRFKAPGKAATRFAPVCDATNEAKAWDGAPWEAQALYLDRKGVWVYARVTVQDRTEERTHTGGIRGKACTIEFWNDGEGFGEKVPGIIFRP